jgi:hypothetical protein
MTPRNPTDDFEQASFWAAKTSRAAQLAARYYLRAAREAADGERSRANCSRTRAKSWAKRARFGLAPKRRTVFA